MKWMMPVIVIVVAALCITAAISWREMNVMPVVSLPNPQPPLPIDNAFDRYVAAARSISDYDAVDFASLDKHPAYWDYPPKPSDRAYSLAEKKELIRQNSSLMAKVHAASDLPYQRRLALGVAPFVQARKLARFLSYLSKLQAQTGDSNGAVSTDLDIMQLAADLGHGAGIEGVQTCFGVGILGQRPAWDQVDHLSLPQTLDALNRLKRIDQNELTYPESIKEEKAIHQAFLMALLRRPDWRNLIKQQYIDAAAMAQRIENMMASWTGKKPQTIPGGWSWRYDAQLVVTSKRAIMSNLSSYMDRRIEYAGMPYSAPAPRYAGRLDPYTALLAHAESGPSFERFQYFLYRSSNELLIASLALRAYKLEYGHYPQSLGQLAPKYFAKVPLDPFGAGEPLHYKLIGAKYVLYSVGPDGKDDRGVPIVYLDQNGKPYTGRSHYHVEPEGKGDIVAGVNF